METFFQVHILSFACKNIILIILFLLDDTNFYKDIAFELTTLLLYCNNTFFLHFLLPTHVLSQRKKLHFDFHLG